MTDRRNAKSWLMIILTTFFVLLIIGYSAFQARKILAGPRIQIFSPNLKVNQIASDPLVEVTGRASNITQIEMDDRPIYIDEKGNFDEKILLFSGYNVIKLQATDQFGKKVEKTIELVYQG